jgi:hypothetical protein
MFSTLRSGQKPVLQADAVSVRRHLHEAGLLNTRTFDRFIQSGSMRRTGNDLGDPIEPASKSQCRPGEGWTPICRSLDVPVPDLPFPNFDGISTYTN